MTNGLYAADNVNRMSGNITSSVKTTSKVLYTYAVGNVTAVLITVQPSWFGPKLQYICRTHKKKHRVHLKATQPSAEVPRALS